MTVDELVSGLIEAIDCQIHYACVQKKPCGGTKIRKTLEVIFLCAAEAPASGVDLVTISRGTSVNVDVPGLA